MATIKIEGSEATVTILEGTRGDGETEYALLCDRGIHCPRAEEIARHRSINLTDTIMAADRHADLIMHA